METEGEPPTELVDGRVDTDSEILVEEDSGTPADTGTDTNTNTGGEESGADVTGSDAGTDEEGEAEVAIDERCRRKKNPHEDPEFPDLIMSKGELAEYLKTHPPGTMVKFEPPSIPPADFILTLINRYGIVIFDYEKTKASEDAVRFLSMMNERIARVWLYSMGKYGEYMTEVLIEITGRCGVPFVFYKGKDVGDYKDLKRVYRKGLVPCHSEITAVDDALHAYDIIVMGAGSGGVTVAMEAARYGRKVVLLDYVRPTPIFNRAWGVGGTCVNVGCVPKKLFHVATLMSDALDNLPGGFTAWGGTPPAHCWADMVNEVNRYIMSTNWIYKKSFRSSKVEYINARGKFISPTVVEYYKPRTKETGQLTAPVTVLATGGRPKYPRNIPGAMEYCLTSDDIFWLLAKPRKTLIIGGGYIALECAGFLNGLGCQVSVMVRSKVLRLFDSGTAQVLKDHLTDLGIVFIDRCVPTAVRKMEEDCENPIIVNGKYEDGEMYEDVFHTVIISTSRTPNTAHIGLTKIGVKVCSVSRQIIVDRKDRTSVDNVYAIGDCVVGVPQLTPFAAKSGKYLIQRLYGGENTVMPYPYERYTPTVVFTPLEYGKIGETQESAVAAYGERSVTAYEEYHYASETPPALGGFSIFKPVCEDRVECYVKIVCVKDSKGERIVGFHMLREDAGEFTQGFTQSVNRGIYKSDLKDFPQVSQVDDPLFANLTLVEASDSDSSSSESTDYESSEESCCDEETALPAEDIQLPKILQDFANEEPQHLSEDDTCHPYPREMPRPKIRQETPVYFEGGQLSFKFHPSGEVEVIPLEYNFHEEDSSDPLACEETSTGLEVAPRSETSKLCSVYKKLNKLA